VIAARTATMNEPHRPKCQTGMEAGFVLDHTHGSVAKPGVGIRRAARLHLDRDEEGRQESQSRADLSVHGVVDLTEAYATGEIEERSLRDCPTVRGWGQPESRWLSAECRATGVTGQRW
jgi:hypothetical protein